MEREPGLLRAEGVVLVAVDLLARRARLEERRGCVRRFPVERVTEDDERAGERRDGDPLAHRERERALGRGDMDGRPAIVRIVRRVSDPHASPALDRARARHRARVDRAHRHVRRV